MGCKYTIFYKLKIETGNFVQFSCMSLFHFLFLLNELTNFMRKYPFFNRLFLLSTFMLAAHFQLESFSQNSYLRKGGGVNEDEALAITVDAQGNTYVTGYYSSTLSFGPFLTVNAQGLSDIFLLKVSPAGQILWLKSAGGFADERALGIACDSNGDVYITGHFQGLASFDNFSISSAGNTDVFLAKYTSAGSAQWVQRMGGTGEDIGYAVAVGGTNQVSVTGEFKNTANFGTSSYTAGGTDAFIATYDLNGGFLWSKSGSGPGNARGLSIACDESGNVYGTGQFSNDITFDQLQSNTILNAVYLVKYSPNGVEQWFRKIAGGSTNIAYGICADSNDEIYLTGDFTGNLVFFPNTANPLFNPYPNKIFLAKYSAQGNLLWAKAHGSEHSISSRAVIANNSGNVFLGGWYTCKLSQYSDAYGQGVFNSTGFRDGFISSFSGNGDWLWAKNFGGKGHDYVNALAVDISGMPVGASTFYVTGIFPSKSGLSTQGFTTLGSGGTSFCNDNYYSQYAQANSEGSSDFAFGNLVLTDREPLDFFSRQNIQGCVRDVNPVCLGGPFVFGAFICPDTISNCGSFPLSLNLNQSSGAVGPQYNWLWSNGATSASITASNTGSYSVTANSVDGCFSYSDSVYVEILPLLPAQTLIDSKGFNNPFVGLGQANTIKICNQDTVVVTISPNSAASFGWGNIPLTGNMVINDTAIQIFSGGYYEYQLIGNNGCNGLISFQVKQYDSIPQYNYALKFPQDTDYNDSIQVCQGNQINYQIIDTLLGFVPCSNYAMASTLSIPQVGYSAAVNQGECNAGYLGMLNFIPSQMGWHTFQLNGNFFNYCDTLPFSVSDSVYITVNTNPTVNLSWLGSNLICPGDSLLLLGSGPNLVWTGNVPNAPVMADSVWIFDAGMVYLSADTISPAGCSSSASVSIPIAFYEEPVLVSQPSNALICPGDSVLLIASNGQAYVWFGPGGPLNLNQQSIYVTLPGFYYCEVLNSSGCPLFTNTLEVKQYTTPFLLVSPRPVLCFDGDSTEIEAVSNIGSTIQWNAPLSGNSFSQFVNQPGTYSAQITSCGITTQADIHVGMSQVFAEIITDEGLLFCEGDSVELFASGNEVQFFVWNPVNASGASFTAFYPGSYTVTGVDSFGCSFVSTPVDVSTFPNLTSPPILTDTLFCPPASLLLSALGQGAIYWFLDSVGGLPLDSGAFFQTPVLQGATTYWVMNRYDDCSSIRVPLHITEAECEELQIANIFTPNADGINDFISFDIEGTSCFHVEIYNRWGSKVYVSENIDEKWYGKVLNTDIDAKDGAYFVFVQYCTHAQESKVAKGTITLVR